MAALLFFVMLAAGALLTVFGLLGILGRLPHGSPLGIRLPYIMECEERWYAAHRAAAPPLVFGGVGIATVNLAFLPFAIAGRIDLALALVVAGISFAALLLVLLQAAMAGMRAAQALED
jgi:uncharacterized membrane protein